MARRICAAHVLRTSSGSCTPDSARRAYFFKIYHAHARSELFFLKAHVARALVELQIPQAVGTCIKFKTRLRARFFNSCQEARAYASALKIRAGHQFAHIGRLFSQARAYRTDKRAGGVYGFEDQSLAAILVPPLAVFAARGVSK